MDTLLNKESEVFLVTGATGNVGRHIVHQLLQKGYKVRALTRNPAKANLPVEAEVVKGDLTRPETIRPALEGVTGLHLITISGDSFEPLQTGVEIVRMAGDEEADVQQVTVLWSGVEGPIEEAVKSSSLEWTILQPQEFMSNTLQWAPSIREEGVVCEAYGDRQTAMIHEADIARVAATVLVEQGHHGKEYLLTGPEVLTIRGAVNIIGELTDQEIRFEELTEAEAHERMINAGIEEEAAKYILSWYSDTPPEGYTVAPTVEEITGWPPHTFHQWVEEHANEFKQQKI